MTEAGEIELHPIVSSAPIQVLHVGPGGGQRGGIASVLGELDRQQEQFRKDHIQFSIFETHGFQSVGGLLRFALFDIPRFAAKMAGSVSIVHFHVSVRGSFYRKYLLYQLARFAGKKTIFHLHAGNFEAFRMHAGRRTRQWVTRFVCGADAVIAVSTATAEELLSYRGDRGGVNVIGNTAAEAEAAAGIAPAESGSSDEPYVAFAARFTPAKGIGDLLDALALMRTYGSRVRLKLAGGGDVERWREAAMACGVADQVSFVGWLTGDAKLAFYRNARVFCMPSHYESFGIATLEAMFSGIPVVGTRLGGFLDLVQDGVTGYLVERGDCEALAKRLHLLMDDPALAEKMGKAGLDAAKQRYSCRAVIDQYVKCYRGLTKKNGDNEKGR